MSTSNAYLASDMSEYTHYKSVRLTSGAIVFIAYVIHYAFYFIAHQFNYVNINDMKVISKRMFLFGIAGILSASLLQGSTWQAVFSVLTLISLLLLHIVAFEDMTHKYENQKRFLWLGYYSLLFAWWLGLIVDFGWQMD